MPVLSVLLFPYLPTRSRGTVGGWSIIPANNLQPSDTPDAASERAIRGLLRLYADSDETARSGALVTLIGTPVGTDFPASGIPDLRRAVIAALLDENPSPFVEATDLDANAGLMAHTSDHADVWGHRIDADGYVAAQYGAMVQTLAGGLNVLRNDSPRFRRPAELHDPLLSHGLDLEFADACLKLTAEGDDGGRRLARAIDWLGLAWRNSPSVTPELRIMALRAGLEVLLEQDGHDDLRALRAALDRLVDPEAPKTLRSRASRNGKRWSVPMTDLGWWLTVFSDLRNDIAHGNAVTPDDYHYGDGAGSRHHVRLGEWWLRQAIRRTIIAAGHPHLSYDRSMRAIRAAIEKADRDPPPK